MDNGKQDLRIDPCIPALVDIYMKIFEKQALECILIYDHTAAKI